MANLGAWTNRSAFVAIATALILPTVAPAVWAPSAWAQATRDALTAEELETALRAAGLDPTIVEDAATGAPVARAEVDGVAFWVRALDCEAGACSTLVFFANFGIGRAATASDLLTLNRFNDRQVFGRAYLLENGREVGVDYVVELDGGVSMENVASNIGRWADVVEAFIDNFRSGPGAS